MAPDPKKKIVRLKQKARPGQRTVLFEFPPTLYLATKAELRTQGRTVREWFIEQMEKFLKEAPKWRAYMLLESKVAQALERGSIRKR